MFYLPRMTWLIPNQMWLKCPLPPSQHSSLRLFWVFCFFFGSLQLPANVTFRVDSLYLFCCSSDQDSWGRTWLEPEVVRLHSEKKKRLIGWWIDCQWWACLHGQEVKAPLMGRTPRTRRGVRSAWVSSPETSSLCLTAAATSSASAASWHGQRWSSTLITTCLELFLGFHYNL